MANELFVKASTKRAYEQNKQDINKESLVFIEKQESLIAKEHEYQFVPSDGEVGQILVKTDGGAQWADTSISESNKNPIWKGTQAEFDKITTKDSNTLYFITEG